MRSLAACVVMLCLAECPARADHVVRVGEQDTCDIAGVTTVSNKGESGHIRFDVSKLPAGQKVRAAALRFWIHGGTEASRAFSFARWNDEGFKGFSVWQGAAPTGDPLDTRYPFNLAAYWLLEFDVTAAVEQWVAGPAKNTGLTANFAFPADDGKAALAAWMRPYLQIVLDGENKHRPPQPGELKAACRYGQTFLTWKLVPHSGAFFDSTYRVYRHTAPITATNLGQAQLLGEVHRLSQLNARRTMVMRGGGYCQMHLYAEAAGVPPQDRSKNEGLEAYWNRCRDALPARCNYVIEHDWEQGDWLATAPPKGKLVLRQGPMLPDDVGLFVAHVPRDADSFYAVTSVIEGNENRDDFSAGNALARPVEEKAGKPRAVVQAVFTSNKGNHWDTWQLRDLAYWEGGDGRLHNTPSTAFNATMDVPKAWAGLAPESQQPTWIVSHAQLSGYSTHYALGSGSRGYDRGSIVMDTLFVPPTAHAPFPNAAGGPNVLWPEYGQFYYGSATPPAGPKAKGREATAASYHRAMGMYGYMDTMQTGKDPRKATVMPYWENRRLFELDYMIACFPDRDVANYTVVGGQWDGLNFAMHHADRFGSVNATMEGLWTTERGGQGKTPLVGLRSWALKNPARHNVWDWNDPVWYSQQLPQLDWPYVTQVISPNYDGVGCWANMGYPGLYFDLAKEKRAGQYWWVNVGDAPEGAYSYVPRNQAIPAIFNVTCQLPPLEEWQEEPAGTLNGYVLWHRPGEPFATPHEPKGKEALATGSGAISYGVQTRAGWIPLKAAVKLDAVDGPDRFEMAFRLSEHTQGFGTGTPVPPVKPLCGAADITPRRLQKFKVEKGKSYQWQNVRVATGQVLQAGTLVPDDRGLLTVPQFLLDKDLLGNKLVITPGTGPARAVDKSQKVVVRWFKTGPDRAIGKELQETELSYTDYEQKCLRPELLLAVEAGRKFVPTMSPTEVRDVPLYSEWGWIYEDGFRLPKSGRYRIEMRVKDAYFQSGAWPITCARFDNRPIGDRVADTSGPATLAWWTDAAQGRHRLAFGPGNSVFNESCPQVPNGKNRGLTIESFQFVPLPERPVAASEVYQVRIRQRSAVVAPDLPLRLGADVVDPWGESVAAPLLWKAAGAQITPDGVFSATAEGEHAVTATAGSKTDVVTVRVKGPAFVEDFDDEWADGWVAPGEEVRPDKQRAAWHVWRKGTGWMGTLHQNTAGQAGHLFVYEASQGWGDIGLQADRLPGRLGAAQGLVFRFQDPRNYCRFEKRTGREVKTTALRIVKVVDGVESVLASVEKEVRPLPIQPTLQYRTFQHWDPAKLASVKPFEIDRFRVELKGEEIKGLLNGQEVLSAKDGRPKPGAVGLYCEGQAVFDNVEARRALAGDQ